MSVFLAIDVLPGRDDPIVLSLDGYEAPMTVSQARTLAQALLRIAADVAGQDNAILTPDAKETP